VGHGGVGLTLEQGDVAADLVEEFKRQLVLEVFRIVLFDEVIEAVELAPHLT